MHKVAVIGSTGYSGQELVDILLKHSDVELACVTARFDDSPKYADIFPRFKNRTSLCCEKLDVEKISKTCDLVFLALPHTVSMTVAGEFLKKGTKVIDLSADYRLPMDKYREYYKKEHLDKENIPKAVYGLPEINRDSIKNANIISNPGCYPTSVILGLLPIIKDISLSESEIIVDSKSGTSGAGRKADLDLSFSEVDGNFKSYKENVHQHMPEMENILSKETGKDISINFVPHLLPVKRGILSTIYVVNKANLNQDQVYAKFNEYYKNEPFVRVINSKNMPQLKDVVNTNYCDIGIRVVKNVIIIVSAIDNLLKGASGQAVQNMNIMFGFNEREGLF